MLRLVLPQPDLRPLRLLCIGAHADDIEIGCGGTVLRLLAERPVVEVTWVVFAGDDARREEAARAANLFLSGAARAHVRTEGFTDAYFPAAWADIKRTFEGLKAVEPDIILTHRRGDRHQDHQILAELTWNTWRDHLVLEYEIPKYEGDLGQPNFYVPLTRAQAERKVEILMEAFVSQRSRRWFDPQAFLGLMRLRGIECNAPEGYAEGFGAAKIVVGDRSTGGT
jgi:LmbE family N-acetylglucosaminyl deacetylase